MNESVGGNSKSDAATNGKPACWVSRTLLPAKAVKADFSVWSFVKQCIGKDLTRISMPVALNEPLSFLQRVAEYMEYSELLGEASKQTDPVRRMEYVCAFALSATSSNHNRIGKPFNPLLGETYELHHNGFVLVAEQVSHHPPITAVHVDSPDYSLWSTVQFKIRFWGKSLEVQPKGFVSLKLHKHQETYTWQYPNLTVNNVLVGKLSLEHVGQMQVTNHTSGHQCQLEFHQSGWFGSQSNHVTGRLMNAAGSVVRHLFGNWTRGLFSVDPQVWHDRNTICSTMSEQSNSTQRNIDCQSIPGQSSDSAIGDDLRTAAAPPQFGFEIPLPNQRCLWSANQRPANAHEYYHFTRYAIGLNELTPELAAARVTATQNGLITPWLPPTDCRFRPDIRALELGQMDVAASEKDRLEEKQRRAVKQQTTNSPRRRSPTKLKHKHHDTDPRQHAPTPRRSSSSTIMTGPIWFTLAPNPVTGLDEWLFTHRYWSRDWTGCPDLY